MQETHIISTRFPTWPVAELNNLLNHEGFGAVKLKPQNLDRDPKRFVIDVEINRVSALLLVDTGAGGTIIARPSLKKFRTVEPKTSIQATTVGKSALNQFWGIANLDTFAIGDCVFHGVPVAIKDIPYCDGLWEYREMHRVGAVWTVPITHFISQIGGLVAVQAANWPRCFK
jgi:hypothetical protein